MAADTIDSLRWNSRLLLLFAPDDAAAAPQRAIDAAAVAGYRDRDIRIVEIIGDKVSGAADRAVDLRRRYRAHRDGFAVLLIGKDGGEKLRSARPIPAERLFGTIDAMPMRRDEMKR